MEAVPVRSAGKKHVINSSKVEEVMENVRCTVLSIRNEDKC